MNSTYMLPLNIGISVTAKYFGFIMAFLSFWMIVIIEANVMKRYFPFPSRKRVIVSFMMNFVSTLIGLPVFYYLVSYQIDESMLTGDMISYFSTLFTFFASFPPIIFDYGWKLWISLLATLIVESLTLFFILKFKISSSKLLKYILRANFFSYAALFFIPWLLI